MPIIDRRRFLVAGGLTAVGVGLSACAADGSWVTVEARAVDELRRTLRGTLLLPGDPGFTDAWMPTNGRYRDTVPYLVARVADEADVATCVKWCREHGIAPVPRGGGHSYAGFSTTTGMVVDLRALNTVRIDPTAATMVTGGGASNADIFSASTGGRLILPGGTCLSVGIGGLTLGGGIGYHTRWAGLTSDRLTGTRMVTAAGEVVEATPSTNPELFWASRGGAGGSFGINTQFTFDLVPVPTENIVYYRLEWRGADAALAMFAAVDALEQTSPPGFVASGMAQAAPVGSGGPREAVDVMLRGQFLGSMDDFRALIAPVLAGAPTTRQQIVSQPFWDTAKIFTTPEASNHSWGDISRYTNAPLPASALQKLVDLIVQTPSRTSTDNAAVFMLGWVGGAVVDRFTRSDTAYVHRGMKNMVRPSPVWANNAPAGVATELMSWTDDVIAVLDPHTPRESYQNFPNRRISDWAAQYYAENLDRLVRVKNQWDPANVFSSPQSIPVSVST